MELLYQAHLITVLCYRAVFYPVMNSQYNIDLHKLH
jgi:hypothetical protein